jgi:hypothetical protein
LGQHWYFSGRSIFFYLSPHFAGVSMSRPFLKIAAAVVVSIGAAHAQSDGQPAPQAAPPAPPPACQSPENRAFDFWLGEWKAYVTGTDQLAGLSTITLEDGGCVVTEHWRSQRGKFSGRSLNIYSAEAGHWEQFWVDSTGNITHFVGNPTTDGMQLTAEDDVGPGAPEPVFTRMTFTRNADGSVRQYGDASSDRGKTWAARYDFTYRKAE